jgi:hypothetical protein
MRRGGEDGKRAKRVVEEEREEEGCEKRSIVYEFI